MNLSNFNAFALTRAEMKNVVGGLCQVCSAAKSGPGGTCGSYSLTQKQASKQAKQNNKGGGGGYTYSYNCQ